MRPKGFGEERATGTSWTSTGSSTESTKSVVELEPTHLLRCLDLVSEEVLEKLQASGLLHGHWDLPKLTVQCMTLKVDAGGVHFLLRDRSGPTLLLRRCSQLQQGWVVAHTLLLQGLRGQACAELGWGQLLLGEVLHLGV